MAAELAWLRAENARLLKMLELSPRQAAPPGPAQAGFFDAPPGPVHRDMSSVSRWRDSGHLERAVETAGGQEAFDAAVGAMLDDARGWRLAEMRKRRGLTQEQVATRMGVSVARVSQIESGDVSTQDVLNRFITALGGTLKLIADFGDEQLKIA
jgi:DNA-binding XRE family transcriptional regulator